MDGSGDRLSRSPASKPRKLERLAHSRVRPLAAVAWKVATACTLAGERLCDAFAPGGSGADRDLGAKLTMLVKTFERPRTFARLLASVRRFYPELPIVVVDDSRQPQTIADAHVLTVTMPFDCGVSAGRNEGLRHVTTPYVLVVDDDFVFHRGTRLEESLRIMEMHQLIDILGGKVIDLPLYRVLDYTPGYVFPSEARPLAELGSLIGGLPVYEKVADYFLARTERLRLVGWDDRLRLAEHADFFTRARGVLVTVYDEHLSCLHAQTPFDRHYMALKENNLQPSYAVLAEKYGGGRPRS